ncbi:uncharacterized protein [Aegilops tauschii subsp. strangulata]|uniref:uncharacterized protein n=1 Tax=Aegilops tauschii subsp. strangulata TaxID=200361 RepID=UPI003CC87B25
MQLVLDACVNACVNASKLLLWVSSMNVPQDFYWNWTCVNAISHRRSASPEYELDAFEYFSIILGTSVSATRQRLPDTFMNMLGEDPPHNVKLRQAGSGVRRLWDVELVIEEGHMYLCRGWEKFYSAYDLRTGYFLLFRYDDDATMLIVKVFNTTMCRMRYTDDEDASNGSSSSDTGYSQSSSDYGCSKSNSDSGFSESSSDSGSSKDSKKDDPDWSGGEKEQRKNHDGNRSLFHGSDGIDSRNKGVNDLSLMLYTPVTERCLRLLPLVEFVEEVDTVSLNSMTSGQRLGARPANKERLAL